MSNTNDKRLSFRPYRLGLESVQTQFDLIRFSLKIIKLKDRKQFFKQKAVKKLADNKKSRIFIKQHKILSDEDADQNADAVIESIKSQLRRENRAGNLLAVSEFSEDRLNQSELLLLVAHFESFMRLVHETFLLAAPHRVFGNAFRGEQNPRIPIKEIFDADQNVWSPQKFLKEQIAKEVKWLDAQNIETKADYFVKYFGISFGNPDEIEELKNIMKRRNEISHEIYEPPQSQDEVLKNTLEKGEEPPLVSNSMLQKARGFFYWIPNRCIAFGGKTYQSYFKEY